MPVKTIEIGGQPIKIRSLKWKEHRQIKSEYFDLRKIEEYADDDSAVEEVVEKVIELACIDDRFKDDLDWADEVKLFFEIFKNTYVPEGAAKN